MLFLFCVLPLFQQNVCLQLSQAFSLHYRHGANPLSPSQGRLVGRVCTQHLLAAFKLNRGSVPIHKQLLQTIFHEIFFCNIKNIAQAKNGRKKTNK